MPYGLKDEEFNKIQNKIAKKLYEVPILDRAAQNTQIEWEN